MSSFLQRPNYDMPEKSPWRLEFERRNREDAAIRRLAPRPWRTAVVAPKPKREARPAAPKPVKVPRVRAERKPCVSVRTAKCGYPECHKLLNAGNRNQLCTLHAHRMRRAIEGTTRKTCGGDGCPNGVNRNAPGGLCAVCRNAPHKGRYLRRLAEQAAKRQESKRCPTQSLSATS